MYEDIMLYGLFEERVAREAVERRVRQRQLGLAWADLPQREPKQAHVHQLDANKE